MFVDFYSPMCGHCKRLEPVWRELAAELGKGGKVVVAKADTARYGKKIAKYIYSGVPTIRWFDGGGSDKSVVYRGARTKQALLRFVNGRLRARKG